MLAPKGQRISKDKMYRCTVSLPPPRGKILPFSVTASYWTKADKTMVAHNTEHSCSLFEKKQ
jgi:hypothetical protein